MSSNEQVEAVARALCMSDGKRPDDDVPIAGWESVRTSPNSIERRQKSIKGWMQYEAEAKRFVAASDALRKTSSL